MGGELRLVNGSWNNRRIGQLGLNCTQRIAGGRRWLSPRVVKEREGKGAGIAGRDADGRDDGGAGDGSAAHLLARPNRTLSDRRLFRRLIGGHEQIVDEALEADGAQLPTLASSQRLKRAPKQELNEAWLLKIRARLSRKQQ